MEGSKRQIPDDNSDAANKEPAYGRRRIAHEASTSRRPESASSKNAEIQQEKSAQNVQISWKLDPIDLNQKPAAVPTAGGSQAVRSSQNVPQFERKFRLFMYKWRWLHDRNHVNYKDKALVEKSWNDVSSACKMSVIQCKDKLEKVKSKYRRLQRLFVDKGSLPDPDMQFIDDWKFLPYKKRSTTQKKTTSTVSSTANQTQSPSTPRSVVQERSSERLPPSNSGIVMNNPMPDQSFADDLAAAMQEFSAALKSEIKSGCWRLVADAQKRAL